MQVRVVYGILLGFYISALLGVLQSFRLAPKGWVARRAALALLRMYALGGGIDDGAAAILEEWGVSGIQCIRELLRENRVPRDYVGYARILIESA